VRPFPIRLPTRQPLRPAAPRPNCLVQHGNKSTPYTLKYTNTPTCLLLTSCCWRATIHSYSIFTLYQSVSFKCRQLRWDGVTVSLVTSV
jgi:hypothetical protein